MTEIGIATLILMLANIFCSVQGLNDNTSLERYNFKVSSILVLKDYQRLFTSGFFHVNWMHLIVNIVSLCFFTGGLETKLGGSKYLLIYFASLLGGNLFALFIYRRKGDFSAVGASGAVSGIIFATIALYPNFQIGFMGIHYPVPGWFFGFLFVLFSIYGIKSKKYNIGYESNLAGGLTGIIIAVLMRPSAIMTNYLAILAIAIPTMFFIFIIITKPRFILIDNVFFNQQEVNSKLVQVHLSEDVDHQVEIDLILEKIHQHGMESLTAIEREKLHYYSKIIQ